MKKVRRFETVPLAEVLKKAIELSDDKGSKTGSHKRQRSCRAV
jgi:hypothetical protein